MSGPQPNAALRLARRIGNQRAPPKFGTAEYRDNANSGVKDLRRTIDYLETRRDVDRAASDFFGYSWRGVNGPVAMAQEPRIRVGVIQIGLLPPMEATPEVDPVGTPPPRKHQVMAVGGHFIPRDLLIRETLAWLDTYLGRVSR